MLGQNISISCYNDDIMKIPRHFTATTVIVCRQQTLLHFHKKLQLWLPVGGHIDRDELPEEAALREVKEETGLEVQLHNPDPQLMVSDTRQLIRPMHLILENINPFHQHIDFIYYARSQTVDIAPADGETRNLRWLTVDEIQGMKMPDNVKALSLEALQLLS